MQILENIKNNLAELSTGKVGKYGSHSAKGQMVGTVAEAGEDTNKLFLKKSFVRCTKWYVCWAADADMLFLKGSTTFV